LSSVNKEEPIKVQIGVAAVVVARLFGWMDKLLLCWLLVAVVVADKVAAQTLEGKQEIMAALAKMAQRVVLAGILVMPVVFVAAGTDKAGTAAIHRGVVVPHHGRQFIMIQLELAARLQVNILMVVVVMASEDLAAGMAHTAVVAAAVDTPEAAQLVGHIHFMLVAAALTISEQIKPILERRGLALVKL
jgi:hypothetical protein